MASFPTYLRRKDSFGLQFSGDMTIENVCIVLFRELKLVIADILGVQNVNRNKVVVKLSTENKFQEIVKDFEDKLIKLSEENNVKIVNLSTTNTYVSIRNAPFELSDELLINIMSRYGKVDSIRSNRFSMGPLKGVLTGIRTVKMKIRDNIPSSLNVFGHNLTILYNGQKKTCYRCGKEGHLLKDCNSDNIEEISV